MRKIASMLLIALLTSFMSCKSNSNSTADTEKNAENSDTVAVAKTQNAEIDLKSRQENTEIIEAELINVEDAGYPMAFLTYKKDNGAPMTLNFDQENDGIRIENLSNLVGKKVIIEYKNIKFIDAFDIKLEGKSLFDRPEKNDCMKEIRGKLIAKEVTQGDLPSEYFIQMQDGEKLSFEAFVTPEMFAANGREVLVCLIHAEDNRLVSIKAK